MTLVTFVMFIQGVHDEGFSFWVQNRGETKNFANLWEFPGGKIEKTDASPLEAITREVQEEVGVKVAPDDLHLFKIHNFAVKDEPVSCYFYISDFSELPSSGRWLMVDYKNKSSVYPELFPPTNYQLIDEVCDFIQARQSLDFEAQV